MSLGEIVSNVGGAGAPVNGVLFLFDAVAYPEITHVDCFAAFLANRLIGYALSSGVVRNDGCSRLGIAKVCKSGA